VPDLVSLLGPVAACEGPRGTLWPSNGGCAVLGQLLADLTGSPFAQAAADLVLAPLGMLDSSFPASLDSLGPDAVSGYTVTRDGVFTPVRARICTIQAAGGLWATPADLIRLGTGWSSLLPPDLASAAVTAQTPLGPGFLGGLGWLVSPGADTAMLGGAAADSAATLTIRIRDNRAHVTVTSGQAAIGQVDEQVLNSWTNPAA
jgi:CubicO group peptidase (beta-lactamase class C family)